MLNSLEPGITIERKAHLSRISLCQMGKVLHAKKTSQMDLMTALLMSALI